MSDLTDEAKAYVKSVVLREGRQYLVEALENIGAACYDEEDDDTLADAVVDSIEAGDIDFDFGFYVARAFGGEQYRLWLDIEEVWK
jgi:hypothetical protein